MAVISLALSCMIPARPMPGRETTFRQNRVMQPAE